MFIQFMTRLLVLASLMAMSGCSDPGGASEPGNRDYQLRWQTCPSGYPERVHCAELILPNELDRLPVRIVRYSGADKAPEPVVYLQGGPGFKLDFSAGAIQAWLGFAEHAGLKRDLILLNRRGASISCPEYQQAQRRALIHVPGRRMLGDSADNALKHCLNRANTLAISDFGTRQSAQDIRALVKSMALPGWHLLGVSYGSRLAIELAGSDGVGAILLDSVYPPDFGGVLQAPKLLGQSLQKMAGACASDADCSRAWRQAFDQPQPPTQDLFIRALQVSLQSLEQRVRDVEVMVDGWPETVWVTPERFLAAAFSASYNRHRWPKLVAAMAAIAEADRPAVSALLQLSVSAQDTQSLSRIAYTAVDCRDNRLGTEQEFLQSFNAYPWLHTYMDNQWRGQPCLHWREAINPVTWPQVQVLPKTTVLAGEFDPITPPHWAQVVKSQWPQTHVAVFAGTGHSVLSNRPCALAQLEHYFSGGQPTIQPCRD